MNPKYPNLLSPGKTDQTILIGHLKGYKVNLLTESKVEKQRLCIKPKTAKQPLSKQTP